MTKPPLLPSLGLSSVLGAVWFLTFSASSPEAEKRRLGFAQSRAFAAAVRGHGEAAGAADKAEKGAEPDVSPVRMPENITMAEAGRIRAAQREFLTNADRWRGAKVEEVRAVTRPWHQARGMWSLHMLGCPYYKDMPDGPGLQHYRAQVDAICADVQQLTPAAKNEWNEWQAKNWEGWAPVDWSSLVLPGGAAENAEPGADEVFETRSVLQARPLLDEYEYIEDMRARADAEVAALEEQGDGGGGWGLGNEWKNTPYTMQAVWLAQFQRVSREMEELARETAQMRERLRGRNEE